MSGNIGLNINCANSVLLSNNLNTYSTPDNLPDNPVQNWTGLNPYSNSDFSDYNPVGTKRAFQFTTGMNFYGDNNFSTSDRVLNSGDTTIINAQAKAGDGMYRRTFSNLNSFVSVEDLPGYSTPLGAGDGLWTDNLNEPILNSDNVPAVQTPNIVTVVLTDINNSPILNASNSPLLSE